MRRQRIWDDEEEMRNRKTDAVEGIWGKKYVVKAMWGYAKWLEYHTERKADRRRKATSKNTLWGEDGMRRI